MVAGFDAGAAKALAEAAQATSTGRSMELEQQDDQDRPSGEHTDDGEGDVGATAPSDHDSPLGGAHSGFGSPERGSTSDGIHSPPSSSHLIRADSMPLPLSMLLPGPAQSSSEPRPKPSSRSDHGTLLRVDSTGMRMDTGMVVGGSKESGGSAFSGAGASEFDVETRGIDSVHSPMVRARSGSSVGGSPVVRLVGASGSGSGSNGSADDVHSTASGSAGADAQWGGAGPGDVLDETPRVGADADAQPAVGQSHSRDLGLS